MLNKFIFMYTNRFNGRKNRGRDVQAMTPPKPSKIVGPEDRVAAATYISELCADLARLSRDSGLETLGYLLDMARLEAEGVVSNAMANRNPPSS
jgi:hypothetical protein